MGSPHLSSLLLLFHVLFINKTEALEQMIEIENINWEDFQVQTDLNNDSDIEKVSEFQFPKVSKKLFSAEKRIRIGQRRFQSRGQGYWPLENDGNECYDECGPRGGPCAFCGSGLCCRWNHFPDWNTLCGSNLGVPNRHTCVRNPDGKVSC